jgi:hypothetical protein
MKAAGCFGAGAFTKGGSSLTTFLLKKTDKKISKVIGNH